MNVDSITKQRVAISNRNMLIKEQQELICDLLHAVNDGCITSKIQNIKEQMNNRNELQHEYCGTLRDFKTSPEQAESTYLLSYEMLNIDRRIFAMASDALRLVRMKPEERINLKRAEILLNPEEEPPK